MPYARTTYTLKDIEVAFRSIDTTKTQGTIKGGALNQQPVPHADIHGVDANNPLLQHPLFAKARVTAGDGPSTHSVMDSGPMHAKLVQVFNSGGMQPFLTNVDNGQDANVNINLDATPGNASVYNHNKKTGVTTTVNNAVLAFFVKVRPNPNNKDIPIIQTCVPRTAVFNAGDLVTKKGVVKGFQL